MKTDKDAKLETFCEEGDRGLSKQNHKMFNIEDWLGSLVPVKGTSKGHIVIVLFTAPQLLWLPSPFTFITACQFVFIGMSFNLKDFITHPFKEELDSLLKPQLRQVFQ